MSTTLERSDNKTEKLQVGSPGKALQITHPKPEDIVNPEIRNISQDVLEAMRLSITAVVANANKVEGNGLTETALAKFLLQLPPQVRTNAQIRAQTLLASDRKNKEAVFGRFADIKIDNSKGSNFQQLLQTVSPAPLDLTKLGFKTNSATEYQKALKEGKLESLIDQNRFADLWGGPVRRIEKGSETAGNVLARPASTPQVQFILKSLHCIDETDPEKGPFGIDIDDTMAVAGVAIGEKGTLTQIPEKSADGGFRDGIGRDLNWTYATFDMTETNHWPKKYGVSLILAEKDFGGLASYMQMVWEKNKEEILNRAGEAAKKLGISIAEFFGLEKYAELVGHIFAEATKWIIKKVVALLIVLFGDDIFAPATVWADFPSITTRWGGSTLSPVMSEEFSGHGGQYRLNYQWQLIGMPVIPQTWSNWEFLGGDLASDPAVVSWGPNRLDIFVRGSDNKLNHKWWDGSVWGGWESLGGNLTSNLAVASWSSNRLDVFVRGVDNGLQHTWWNGSAWGGWESLGGGLTSDPAVVSWGPNRLDIFVRGSDNGIHHRWWDGSAWGGWASLGGNFTSNPAVASWSPNRLDVFVRGVDNTLQHNWSNGLAWGGWESLGGGLTSDPVVVSWGPNRLDIFVRGSDNGIHHRWWDGSVWGGWASLGGISTSAPVVESWGPNQLDVFIRGTDNVLYHKTWNGSAWSEWKSLGGVMISKPAVVSWEPNRLDVFIRGTDNGLHHKSFS